MKTILLAAAAATLIAAPAFASLAPGGLPKGDMTLDQFEAARLRQLLRLDADHDGRLSKAEYEGAIAKVALRRGGVGDKVFNRLDTDHDGYLSQAELTALMAARFKRLDKNGDGVLSADERDVRRAVARPGL